MEIRVSRGGPLDYQKFLIEENSLYEMIIQAKYQTLIGKAYSTRQRGSAVERHGTRTESRGITKEKAFLSSEQRKLGEWGAAENERSLRES